ncbi:MAG: tetratricopeptide repeat protein, partial [Smithella sp.]
NNLAIALTEKGRIDEAIYHYNQSINIAPDGVPYNNLGNIYADLGQYQKALDYYNEAIHLRPDYADAYYNRGLVYAKLERYEAAIENYNQAIHLKPSAQAYNNRGNIHNRLGRYEWAVDDYNNAIKLEGNYPWFYINRAAAYFNQGNNKSGCADAKKACDMGNCIKLEEAKVKGICHYSENN